MACVDEPTIEPEPAAEQFGPSIQNALLLAQLPAGVIVADAGGRITMINTLAALLWPALARVTGPQPLIRPDDGWQAGAQSLLLRAAGGEHPPAIDIQAGTLAAAETNFVHVVVTPLRGSDQQVVGAVAVCTVLPEAGHGDRPQAKRAETARQENRELVRSNMELEQFASVASHDLQEPLRKILAFGDRLRRSDATSLSEQGQDSLGRMLTAAGRMQTLIGDLLSYARVTISAQPFVPVDLAAVAAGVLGDLETRIAEHGGRVEVEALPTIDADPRQMRQLLQNLLSNALKFQRADCPPVVRISAKITEPPPRAAPDMAPWYQLVVQDNGIGFEQQYAERIFQVFQRLHGRADYEGTGIGLAICHQIVAVHGGTIRAEGRPGAGATFVVTLPTHPVARGVG